MTDDRKDTMHFIPEHLDKIFDLISDGLYISDRHGRTLKVNSMYERLSGLKKENLLGRNVKHLVDEGFFDTILNPKIVKTRKPATSLQIGKKGKRLVLNGYPILDDNDNVILVVTFVRDITLMTQLREQIRFQRKLVEKYRTGIQYISEEQDYTKTLITRSPAIQDIIGKIENFADTDATVLLLGETGTGKDVFARRIHKMSSRSNMPFIKVDCPTIPESLLESELFGYAPGAFSGARANGKLGFFEMADKGTLFLDEIGELPLPMQAKLLRVLQDREIVRIGSTKIRKVDVRVVSATNRDLDQEVRQGRFRRDLFYRLRVAEITIPPLRDRPEDIGPLAQHFLKRYSIRYKRDLAFKEDTLHVLQKYSWPGNIRELENLVQSLVISRQTGVIRISDLPSNLVGFYSDSCQEPADTDAAKPSEMLSKYLDLNSLSRELEEGERGLKAIVKDIEAQILRAAVKKYGSHTEVAKRFKINRSTLFRKLRSSS